VPLECLQATGHRHGHSWPLLPVVAHSPSSLHKSGARAPASPLFPTLFCYHSSPSLHARRHLSLANPSRHRCRSPSSSHLHRRKALLEVRRKVRKPNPRFKPCAPCRSMSRALDGLGPSAVATALRSPPPR
jgi:hypothetical protein